MNSDPRPEKLVNCYFNERLLADGKSYKFHLHKITGIKGGTGPTGSIGSEAKTVYVPRSRFAERAHRIGRIIKLFTLGIAVLFFIDGIHASLNLYFDLVISIAIIAAGGGLCHLFYRYLNTKSLFFHAPTYPKVKQLIEKGYQKGFHPLVSTTPFGIVIYFIRLIV